ncbi:hypothetical protein ACLB2K_027569 [Fragaria x ananassa]
MLVALRRRLCSSVSSIELIKVYTASRSIGSSSCTEVAANVAQDCSSSESKIENGPFASPTVRNILRRRRLGIRRSRSTRDTDAIELALDSVVKIFTVASSPNYFLPWQNKSQRETMGSGFVIAGNKILTNAHVVADHTFVLVRKHGSPTKHKAQVEAVGHECDLAILSVESDMFWEGMNPLELGDIPLLQEAVAVVGYPQGGDNISVTKGVVSRVEPTQYVHGATQLMAIQIDAAINPGNSGGPAIMGSKVAGVAFQNLSGAENIGYIIPVPVIKHFIAGVEERGRFVGFCSLGLSCQPTENVQLRNHFRMNPEMTGVLVSKINPLSDAHKVLKKYDIVLVFDGVPVANDGTVHFRNRERIAFDHLVSMKKPNETAVVRVLRDGKEYEFIITLQPVLMDDINAGYERLAEVQVKKVNGKEVENLKHLCQLVESCTEESTCMAIPDRTKTNDMGFASFLNAVAEGAFPSHACSHLHSTDWEEIEKKGEYKFKVIDKGARRLGKTGWFMSVRAFAGLGNF